MNYKFSLKIGVKKKGGVCTQPFSTAYLLTFISTCFLGEECGDCI